MCSIAIISVDWLLLLLLLVLFDSGRLAKIKNHKLLRFHYACDVQLFTKQKQLIQKKKETKKRESEEDRERDRKT